VSRLISLLLAFSRWCHEFGTLLVLPSMALIITFDVGARYFFNAPLMWGEEVNGLLLFLVLMLSMTYTWDKGRHIRMELLYVRLTGTGRVVADLATGITGIVFFGFLGVQSVRDIDYMRRTNEGTEVLQIALWPFRALMALICAVFVFKLLHFLFVGRKEIAEQENRHERDGVLIERKIV
jgi:TRAP-type C4-dicarboxylate transport system permease small subunit